MSRLLVNIRGCNGAGKSTIPMSMMDDPDMFVVERDYQGKKKKVLTVFPTYGWVALGTYFNKTGGMDCLPNNELTRKTLMYALKKYPEYNILMEGIMASTIFSTYSSLFHEVEKKYPDIRVVIVSFVPPFETCLKRIYERNGGKPIKEDGVLSKWKTVERNVEKFRAEDFISLKINNAKTQKKNMLSRFLNLMSKYEEG